ncbi:MAG TPA: helicase-related protein [archaeon]|nr:helicase-related protein [archaeon]
MPVELKNIEPRDYQINISETATRKNTLVVLPTGIGKTLIAILVAIERLKKFPQSKILIMAPTRPLNAQHKKSFEQQTTVDAEKIILITGKIQPSERTELYDFATVVVATPQTIENDVEAGRLHLRNFSLAVFDEAHRSVKDYAYTYVSKKYREQSEHPLILGLTASPGATEEKIEEIKNNLFVEAVEIRSEQDEDVSKYVKEIQKDFLYVDFPAEFQMLRGMLQEILKDSIYWLAEHHIIHTYRPSKRELLAMQIRTSMSYSHNRNNYGSLHAMLRLAEAIKLEHAIELLETQGMSSLHEYLHKLGSSKKNTDRKIMRDPRMIDAYKRIQDMHEQGIDHPKAGKLKDIVKDLLKGKSGIKIIIFANYRSAVEKIRKLLEAENISAQEFIGQTMKSGKGMTQDQQIAMLSRFRNGEFNVLVSTSIGEEGLDVPSVDYAIFYEPVPSEIRAIQRRGRVGRQVSGKTIFLITKDTRDEAYFFAAINKEKRMRGILHGMKKRLERKKSLKDFIE